MWDGDVGEPTATSSLPNVPPNVLPNISVRYINTIVPKQMMRTLALIYALQDLSLVPYMAPQPQAERTFSNSWAA